MVFSSSFFLFGFLPIAILLYYFSPRAIKNTILLLISLVFYAWGEVFYLAIMVLSIISNYIVGRSIGAALKEKNSKKSSFIFLLIGIIINIGLLISFKYANFITDNLNVILFSFNLSSINLQPVHLPLGISFFTFQAISYIVDVYRREVKSQNNLINLALYISLFPQLIAGPIVRYHDIATQITDRTHSIALFSSGVQRFIFGLAKKMLIANSMGEVADNVFTLSGGDLTMPLAWIGILAYSLQIYFDFSGYSDMAIGLGRMFGFRFLENFNYPYISTSMREFWKRWHISLSTWFRDYVYIALGGNKVSAIRVYLNLFIVFILTGVWHGASWNFLVWGLFHGIFLVLERVGLLASLKKMWKPLQHIYLLMVVIVSWVFFRSENIPQSINYLSAMIEINNFKTTEFQLYQILSRESVFVFIVGTIMATPVYRIIRKKINSTDQLSSLKSAVMVELSKLVFLSCLLYLSILKVVSSTYNPFIYFRF